MALRGQRSKGVSTRSEKSGTYYDETELEKSSVTLYRSCVMRLAYLSADLPHLQVLCKSVGTWHGQGRREATGNRLKRAVRYLKVHGRWVQEYRLQDPTSMIDIFTGFGIGRVTRSIARVYRAW